MKKRLLAAIMSLCMIVSLLPVSALAVETRQLPLSDTITVGETRNYTGTVGDGTHNWESDDETIATVESGNLLRDNEYASVTGHRPGTVKITHTYQVWDYYYIIPYLKDVEETLTVTVQQDSTPGNHTAYFYVVNPETAQEPYTGREDEYFNYLGMGTVSNIPAADAEGYREKEFWIGINQETKSWTNTPPESPLYITYHGTTYEYWDNVGTPPEHYYTVTWYRYSSSSGYVDQNGTEHDDIGMCWHLDGYVELNDMVQVRFKVKFPGDEGFSYVDANGDPGSERNIWYVEKNKNFFSGITNPPKTNALEGYVFKGWYTDEACTDPVNEDTVIGDDMTFYGKYEEDVPDITVTKTLDDSTVHAGEDAVWTITVTNNTDATISGLKISDSLTVDGTPVSGDYTSGGVSISPKSNPSDNLNGFIVEGNSFRTFTAQYKVKTDDVGKELVNTATVTTTDGETYHDTATNTVQAVVPTEPDLSVTKTVTLSNGTTIPSEGVNVGDTLKYTVTVTNSGAAADASAVVVTDSKFPENKNNVTVTSSSGAETVAWSGSSATIISELAKGESVTFTYTYSVTEQDQYEGTVSNTASVTFNNVKQDTATRDVSVKAKTYSLTYNANYGTFENSKTTFVVNGLESGTEYPLGKEEDYQKPTHAQENLNGETVNVAFIGWTLSNNNGFIYSANAPNLPRLEDKVTIQSPGVTVYAVWGYDKDGDDTADVLEHTVTFDAQGGTPVPETQYVQDGEKATEPDPAPTKDGFTFAGWYLNDEPYDFTAPVTSDMELVARWTDATRYTVTYNANNGTLIGASSVTVIPGRAVQLESSATRDGYIFMGWTTETILGQTYGVGASLPETIFQSGESFTPTGNTPLYAVWGEDRNHDDVADVYEVFIAPADITIYTGGTGYEGVSDGDGNEIENSNSGLPEPGFHIILPADLGLEDGNDLNGIVKFQYNGRDTITGTDVSREWTLSCVGVYSETPLRYVYSLVSTGDTPAVRVTYTGENGEAVEHDRIDMSANAASAKYDMSINAGGLEQNDIVAVITTADGTPATRNLVIGTGELTIRSTVDRTDNTNTIADNAGEVSDGSFNAVGNNATYVDNDSDVPLTTANDPVQLLVDQVSNSTAFNNAMGEAAVEKATVSGTAHETVYLDLVDTQNGNTVVTLNTGSMDIYWPMPSNADPYGDFQVVHYVDMNREVSASEDQLDNQRTELLDGTAERINGDWYVHFTTRSFSPFVLVYEEDTSRPVNPNPGGGSGGDSDSDPTGNLSIELDVNGGDDEFTFTVILTDKDGDDLKNNFYYNGDYTGTIGSGDEITLEGGEKIVIRNLPEGTRYEVIIETADGYTYVIDGEEGVIHTGMNEAEFTATRTVPVADPSVTGVSRWLNTTDHIAYLTGYPGGAFGPDNNMTRAEVAQMFYALLNNKNVTITKTFPDVPADAWYATAVNTLASLGMVSGDENGNYRPNDPITRAEFCVIALAFAYEPENAVCYFGDVSRSDWFYTYVAQAASYGWIGGYTNGNFGPNDRITRAQVTTIVNNMLGRAADRDYVIDHQADLVQFTDLTRAHWGYFQIMEATNAHDYTKSNGTENWR